KADVVPRGFRFFVEIGANFPRRLVDCGRCPAIELHEPEGFDLLRLPVFGHVEIGRLQVGNLVAVAVGDDDVDADEVDPRAEHRLLGIRWRWLLIRWWLLALSWLWLSLLLGRLLLRLGVAGDAQNH